MLCDPLEVDVADTHTPLSHTTSAPEVDLESFCTSKKWMLCDPLPPVIQQQLQSWTCDLLCSPNSCSIGELTARLNARGILVLVVGCATTR